MKSRYVSSRGGKTHARMQELLREIDILTRERDEARRLAGAARQAMAEAEADDLTAAEVVAMEAIPAEWVEP